MSFPMPEPCRTSFRILRPALCALILASLGRAQEWSVEPTVRAALVAAKEHLPDRIRGRLEDVRLVRATDLGVPDDAPLSLRLLGRAAHAAFQVVPRTITVFDGGAAGRSTWGAPPPDRAALATFLGEIADVLGVEAPVTADDPCVELAWAAFATRVFAWSGTPPPDPMPEPGDPVVLDRFLDEGPWRALGERVPLEQLLFHELAHGLQLSLDSLGTRMEQWATVSGWVECRDGDPTDGFAGGMNSTELPIVLIRLLLAEDPAMVSRGAALYRPAATARFPNRYARYDLREDYAECLRLMQYAPERLAKVAPEKFLFANAIGWNAELSVTEPGPLWIAGDRTIELLGREALRDGFVRLLVERDDLPSVDPFVVAALLRAHVPILRAEDLPPPNPIVPVPADVPDHVRGALEPARLGVAIDGVVFAPTPTAQRAMHDQLVASWWSMREFGVGLMKMFDHDADDWRKHDERDVANEPDPLQRGLEFDYLLRDARGVLPEAEYAALCAREQRFQREQGHALIAARIALLGGAGPLEERLPAARAACAVPDLTLDLAMLFAAIAKETSRHRPLDEALVAIRAVPGTTLGAALRVELLLELVGDSEGARRDDLLQEARRVAAAIPLPSLRSSALANVGLYDDRR